MVDNNALVGMTLHGGGKRVKFQMDVTRLRELSARPSSLFWAGGGAGRYGDGEPNYAFNEQRDWIGGRGLEFFVDDPSRYFDGYNAATFIQGRVGPVPQAFFGRGYRPNGAEFALPGDVTWQAAFGGNRYISRTFTPSANITADKAYLPIRRIGTPGTGTLELCSDSSGSPGAVLKTATVTTTNIDDFVSKLYGFDWTTTEALAGSTVYHLKFYGASTDDGDDHWEIGVDVTGSSSKYSSNDSTWTSAPYSFYYRLVGADIKASHEFFVLDEAQYVVSKYTDGTASKVFINGARGKATSATSTVITNTDAAFGTSSEFVNAIVKIIRGTGAGQFRTITSHTGTALTTAAWHITPDNTSEYIIYQTSLWAECTTTGLGVVKNVAVYNNIAYFAQGEATNIRTMRFNPAGTPPAHEYQDDGTNKASYLEVGYKSATPGLIIAKANNDITAVGAVTIAVAPGVVWGTDHTFGTAIKAGNGNDPITSMRNYTSGTNSRLYVMKTAGLGFIDVDNAKWYDLNVNLRSVTESTNGIASIVHGLNLHFNWSWSQERLYGEALDDLDPNSDAGLPTSRQGYISGFLTHPAGLFCSIDADDQTSSVMLFMGGASGYPIYHEIFRGFEAGKRIKGMAWQANEGGKKYLWISVGDDLVYMEFPRNHRNPFRDSTQNFEHEFNLTTSIFDMGNGSIYKAFKDLTLITKNFDGAGIYAKVDIQLDNDINTDTWRELGIIGKSPSDSIEIMEGEVKQARFRIRAYTNDSVTPPIIYGMILKGVGQLPTVYDDSFWAEFGSVSETIGGADIGGMEDIIEGMGRARIWTIEQCDYKRVEGKRVLASVVEVDPLYVINNKDNVRAQIHLSGLDG